MSPVTAFKGEHCILYTSLIQFLFCFKYSSLEVILILSVIFLLSRTGSFSISASKCRDDS